VNRELGAGGEIRDSVSSELPNGAEGIRNAVSPESQLQATQELRSELTFTHYRDLMRIPSSEARSFYEVECSKAGWSFRQLQRQISSFLFEGLAKSRDKEMRDDENPPIGLILCTDSNEAIVKYALSKTASQIFASRYQLHLPSEEELARELQRERELLEQQLPDSPNDQ